MNPTSTQKVCQLSSNSIGQHGRIGAGYDVGGLWIAR